MFAAHNDAIGALLRQQGVATARLHGLEKEVALTGRSLAAAVVSAGLIDRGTLLRQIAKECGCGYVPELPAEIPAEMIGRVPAEVARPHGVLPWRSDDQTIDLLVTNPFGADTADELAFVLEHDVRLFVADPESIQERIDRYYGDGGASEETTPDETALTEKDIEALASADTIVTYVNGVLARAVHERASDIHFEPFEHEFRVRYRIDGVFRELPSPPAHLARPILSRVKVLANLNITERRLAQDGRVKVTVEGRAVDLRVSTLPTQFGESIVLRVLDQSAIELDLAQLGMPADVLAGIQDVLRRPSGILIVTGPTGCGKTTTLYSGLRAINTDDLKLLTIEDPVEYELEGVMQVGINPVAGLTFATALRSFLRQDPDVIMVGEIRDLETAQIAIQAALTGHLVLTTLHTNDATGAIARLVDMGVEPFLLASTLEAVIAQRLVRRVCEQCREPARPAGAPGAGIGFCGRGCPSCAQSGYRGRTGIFEFLSLDEEMRELVTARASTEDLRHKAVARGMRLLREEGLRAIAEGRTTSEEVLKFT